MTPLSPAADVVMIRSANATGVLSLVIFMRSTPFICRGAGPSRRVPLRSAYEAHSSTVRRSDNPLRRRSLPINVATDSAKSP
jgi:hypothetical protein